MAATRLIALHKNKGKSVAACLKSRTDYVQNPDKTEQGELVSCYECSPLTVDEEFMLSKRQYLSHLHRHFSNSKKVHTRFGCPFRPIHLRSHYKSVRKTQPNFYIY